MTNKLAIALQTASDALLALGAKTYPPDIRSLSAQAESALAALDVVYAAHRITNVLLVELAREAGELGNYDLTETDEARITINEGLQDALHEAHEWALEHEEAEEEEDTSWRTDDGDYAYQSWKDDQDAMELDR